MHDEPWDICVGVIAGAHGIRGEVRVQPETDDPTRFANLTEVRLRAPDGTQRDARLESFRPHRRGLLVKFAGLNDRTAAEDLRGWGIQIQRRMALPLGEDEYYVHDVIGLEVVTTDGEAVGRVTEVLRTGANDVYVTPRGLIPATKEVVKRVDLEAGRILIEPMPGLLD